jgi:DNA polymerase I-like protein with 3'-5' exonuclease and polymerase domains
MDFTTKDLMIPPEDRTWVEVDLSQIEVRVLAAVSNCGNYITQLNDPDFDPHCMSGALAAGVEYSYFVFHYKLGDPSFVEARRFGKTISFEFQYGAAAGSIAKRNNIPLSKVEAYARNFEKLYPEVMQFHKKNRDTVAREHGKLFIDVLRNGVVKAYPRWWNVERTKYDKWNVNQIMNYPIQGISYDVNKLVWIQPMSSGILKHRQVHDSILYSVPDHKLQEGIQEIRSVYDTLQAKVTECLFDCPVILPYELKVGKDLTFKEVK